MHAIFETATGRLVSTASDISLVASPLPVGLSSKLIADPAAATMWSTAALDFVPRPAPRIISKVSLIQRFTLAERTELFGFNFGNAYTAAQQKNLASFMRYLDFLDSIPLDDVGINQGVNRLVTVGILTAERATQVLA